jgi:hypothetical protein
MLKGNVSQELYDTPTFDDLPGGSEILPEV